MASKRPAEEEICPEVVKKAKTDDKHSYSPVAPYITVNDGHAALDFYSRAFGATCREKFEHEGKLGHATLTINGGDVFLSNEFPTVSPILAPTSLESRSTVCISLHVDDVDVWYKKALDAGATVMAAPKDEFFGRIGKVRDPFGHLWSMTGPLKSDAPKHRFTTITHSYTQSRSVVYKSWLEEEQLVKWYHAGGGWWTPSAKVDVKVGGRFNIRFQSGDNAEGFDLTGCYNELVPNERIKFTMDDGRPATAVFTDDAGKTKVTLTFALEDMNSEEMQRQGWGEMLANLEKHLG